MTITTTQETNQFNRIANDNAHLLKEKEVVVIKNNFGQRKYKKFLNTMKLIV